jgi:hypothetical protein
VLLSRQEACLQYINWFDRTSPGPRRMDSDAVTVYVIYFKNEVLAISVQGQLIGWSLMNCSSTQLILVSPLFQEFSSLNLSFVKKKKKCLFISLKHFHLENGVFHVYNIYI